MNSILAILQSGKWLYQFLLSLMLFNLTGPISNPAAQEAEYQLIIAARPEWACVNPHQKVEIRAIVVRTKPGKLKRIPNISIVPKSISRGTISPTIAFTDGPLMTAKFTYTSDSEGPVDLLFEATGKDRVNGETIMLSEKLSLTAGRCSYLIQIAGYTIIEKDALREEAAGQGTAQVNEDHSISGKGVVNMSQQWGLPKQICQNQKVSKKFPFTIKGNYSVAEEKVSLSLQFEGEPVPQQSQRLKCDTGAGSSVSFLIPVWPITPAYLPITQFDVSSSGGDRTFPYPMKGVSGDLKVSVTLVQEK